MEGDTREEEESTLALLVRSRDRAGVEDAGAEYPGAMEALLDGVVESASMETVLRSGKLMIVIELNEMDRRMYAELKRSECG